MEDLERAFTDAQSLGNEIQGEWLVEHIMKSSSDIWLAVVKNKEVKDHSDMKLVRYRRRQNFSIGQKVKVKVFRSENRPDFFIATKD